MDRKRSRGFLHDTLAPLFLMVVTPNAVVMLMYLVIEMKSSPGSVARMGFATFYKKAWLSVGIGNSTMWKFLIGFILYSGLTLLMIGGKLYHGPPTKNNFRPVYYNSGFGYYCVTMILLTLIISTVDISFWNCYKNLVPLTGSLLVLGFTVCLLLFLKGLLFPSPGEHGSSGNYIFDFYWGLELYPRLGDKIDIKQWTNSRFGMMLWQLIVIACWMAQIEHSGWNWAMASTSLQQIFFIGKFFWWEDGYMQSIDIIVDRAGFYICWGCICFLTTFYPLTSIYMVENSPDIGLSGFLLTVLFGFSMAALTYWTDYQRQITRLTDADCTIWGKPAKVIRAKYTDDKGVKRNSLLLCSGFWSWSRHLNYVFEILTALAWALPALFANVVPYAYVVFLTVLLTHRSFRDEEKCRKKYGKFWEQYCREVPYQMVPGVF